MEEEGVDFQGEVMREEKGEEVRGRDGEGGEEEVGKG